MGILPRYRDAVRPPIKPSVFWTLSALGAPQPRGLTRMAMYSWPHRCRFALFIDIVAAIAEEGPGMTMATMSAPRSRPRHGKLRQCGRSDRAS